MNDIRDQCGASTPEDDRALNHVLHGTGRRVQEAHDSAFAASIFVFIGIVSDGFRKSHNRTTSRRSSGSMGISAANCASLGPIGGEAYSRTVVINTRQVI